MLASLCDKQAEKSGMRVQGEESEVRVQGEESGVEGGGGVRGDGCRGRSQE